MLSVHRTKCNRASERPRIPMQDVSSRLRLRWYVHSRDRLSFALRRSGQILILISPEDTLNLPRSAVPRIFSPLILAFLNDRRWRVSDMSLDVFISS